MRAAARAGGRSIGESLKEYGRGVAGGLIFSLPLLYTQEVWQLGAGMRPERLLVGVGATVILLIGYNRYAGMRRDASWLEVLIDSIEELGLGFVVAGLILWLLASVEIAMHLSAIVGAVVLEGLLAAIGVSVGTAQLGGPDDEAGSNQADEDSIFARITLGACGAILVAANVAPTEEFLIIAGASVGWRLLVMAGLALLLTAMITFYSDFIGTGPRPAHPDILRETLIFYAVSLLVSAALLWFFNRLDGQPLSLIVARTVVLSLPAALGASAGRLLVQGGTGS